MRNDIDLQKDYIIQKLSEGVPRFELARELDCKYDTLKLRLDKWGVKFKNQARKGIFQKEQYKEAENYLKNGKAVKSHALKLKLLREGIKDHRCEKCDNTEWNSLPVPLELHHVNGDRYDNRLENLQLLCPNCHAQEPNNSGSARKSTQEVQKLSKRPHCSECGKRISYSASKCKSCTQRGKTRIEWPSHAELMQMVYDTNYSEVGRQLGVSDNAVRKRLKNHADSGPIEALVQFQQSAPDS